MENKLVAHRAKHLIRDFDFRAAELTKLNERNLPINITELIKNRYRQARSELFKELTGAYPTHIDDTEMDL